MNVFLCVLAQLESISIEQAIFFFKCSIFKKNFLMMLKKKRELYFSRRSNGFSGANECNVLFLSQQQGR